MLNKVVIECSYEIAATNLTVYAVYMWNKCLPIGFLVSSCKVLWYQRPLNSVDLVTAYDIQHWILSGELQQYFNVGQTAK